MWKEYNKDADDAEQDLVAKVLEREKLESVEHLTIPMSEVCKIVEAYSRTVTGNKNIMLVENGKVNFITNDSGRPSGIHVTWNNKY